jgi:wyosine [tRNA(Phe)-imidazoG37] synthetase (radical SAM superfamily)
LEFFQVFSDDDKLSCLMGVFLFDDMIFGPVKSRRLGVSLGINLLPNHAKFCNFNCIYCECGWTKNKQALRMELPKAEDLLIALAQKLKESAGTELEPDSITFAGNGEPTMHPEFDLIIRETIKLRDKHAPKALVSVLSNGSMLHKPLIIESLKLADNNILKLDGGTENTIRKINMPLKAFRLNEYVAQLRRFNGKIIIQTLFVRGKYGNEIIDNTTQNEIDAWIKLLLTIQPQKVMIYAIERDTPAENLEKISLLELERIAEKVTAYGIKSEVFA